MKILKKIGWFALVLFLAIQLYRPAKNITSEDYVTVFEIETNPSAQVKLVLKENCYDCHSNQTSYLWYHEIAPISFWISDHIKHGKGDLNFSNWKSYSTKKKDHKLEELIEEIEANEMPLKEYTWTHGKLSDAEKELLLDWAKNTRLLYQLGKQPK